MAVSRDRIEQTLELLGGLGALRSKRMFGAVGLYCDELFFAVLDADDLYLKVDDESEGRFREAGSERFSFEKGDGEIAVMSYWRMPESGWDDADEARAWARLGVEAALRARARKPKPNGKPGA